MRHPFRSFLTVGVATITATAMTFTPAVEEPTPTVPTVRVATPAVQLTAQVQPFAAIDLPNLLVDWVQRLVVPPSAGQPFPSPEFPPVVGGTSIDSTIKNIYNAVEPWVQYGFELATYAVGWVPYVGWLSGQIMIFYHFGERIVRSITFNIADWLGGNVSFVQGLINVGVDTVNSFIQLGIDEWNFWLPPLPPLPPFPFSATEATTEATAAGVTETAPASDKHNVSNGEESADGATDATTEVTGEKKSELDVVKETKKPETTTGATNVDSGEKKGDKGPKVRDATQSATDSSATNDDTGTKRDKQDGKKE